MDPENAAVARACLAGAADNSMTFPEIVATLMSAGFEGYTVDFRRRTASYYLPDGDFVDLSTHPIETPIGSAFDQAAVQSAIREAQQLVPGYSYRGFCEKVAAAGCAGYTVSFLGRRALYVGRTGETHTEHFPD